MWWRNLTQEEICVCLCGWAGDSLASWRKMGYAIMLFAYVYFNPFSPNNGKFHTNSSKYQNLKDITFQHEEDQHDMQCKNCRKLRCHFLHVSGEELRQSLWFLGQLANQHCHLLPFCSKRSTGDAWVSNMSWKESVSLGRQKTWKSIAPERRQIKNKLL